jgi:Xaa-Pro aminopeptidase
MPDRRADRLRALRDRLAEEALDGLVVSHPANVRYLTGFSGSSGLVMVTEKAVLLLTDFRYRTQAAEEVGDLARIDIDSAGLVARLLKLLPEYLQVRTLGFEAHVLTVRDAARLSGPDCAWRFRPTSDLVEGLRTVKDADEVAAVGAAGQAACAALGRMVDAVRVGMSELEVAALLEAELRRAGSEAHPFDTIVASGPRAALPHACTSRRTVAAGEWLLLDFGSRVAGYCADVTRTFVVGTLPDRRQQEVYEVVREAQCAALQGLRAGMTGKEGDALARDRIAQAGFGEEFGHSLGHGLGLEVHEAPRLSKVYEQTLPAGAVVTVEPGVYLPGWGGVRIEDDVVLSEQGATLLTDFPRELVVLG